MIYEQLYERAKPVRIVRAGLIGSGEFGTAVVTQSQSIPLLNIAAIADIDRQAARQTYRRAGIADDQIIDCDSRAAAMSAIEAGKKVIVEDGMLLMDLPLDVIAEATGSPEAGARFAFEAIQHGKHVAMVNKEADSVVGPYLSYLAARASLVYTAVDGDHHGLLMGLVGWTRSLGLEIICAGKVRTTEFVYDSARTTVTAGKRVINVPPDKAWAWDRVAPGTSEQAVRARRETLGSMSLAGPNDVSEIGIAANAIGLPPDVPELHRPVLRTVELPEVLSSVEEGGILHKRGVVEMISCLRGEHEAGLGGGLFVTVSCTNDYSRHIITTKGCLANSRGTTALIYRPYHLCGVEAPTTILCAGLLGVATGSATIQALVDTTGRTTRDVKKGTSIADHSPDLFPLVVPASTVAKGGALPYYMAVGNAFSRDVAEGTIITAGMITHPADSFLWQLRGQQDEHFAAH